jgi:uncharacterized protein YecT (DUF1311 family)
MRSAFNPAFRVALICILQLGLSFVAESSRAQTRMPTASEIASIRGCAARNKDDLDKGERQCLFKLVAERCIGKPGAATDRLMTDCYRIENSVWDALLNENYKSLLATLDKDQAAKAQAMQRAWIAYRDTTCEFYYDKIQGSMANMMIAACVARESSRRAMLLNFFGRL